MRRHVFVCVMLLAFVTGPLVAGEDRPLPPAAEILERMQAKYASLGSYRDSGRAVVTIDDGRVTTRRRVDFRTLYRRSGSFRFEFDLRREPRRAASVDRSVVWADSDGIQSWSSSRPTVHWFDSIEMALAGPTGASLGSAVRIPGLLMPETMWGSDMRRLEQAVLLGVEPLGMSDCYRTQATVRGSGQRLTLWIDDESLMLRKVEFTRRLTGGAISHTTTSYFPAPEAHIADHEFRFDPP